MARAWEEVVTTTGCPTREGEEEEGVVEEEEEKSTRLFFSHGDGQTHKPPCVEGAHRRGARGDIQVWMRAESRGEC